VRSKAEVERHHDGDRAGNLSRCAESTTRLRRGFFLIGAAAWCGKSARHVLWEPGAGDRLRRPGGMGNGALPNGPTYRAHPRLYQPGHCLSR
jgi:hypothetical protein